MRTSKASDARRVASEVAAIRAALKKRGYRTRKSPNRPVWLIFVNAQCCFCPPLLEKIWAECRDEILKESQALEPDNIAICISVEYNPGRGEQLFAPT